MAIKTASNRRAEAASAVSSQSVVINTSTGLSTYSQTAGVIPVGGNGPTITSVAITDNSYNVWDDTAAGTLGNSYIKITGTNFQSTANVWVAGVMIPKANVTFVSSTELRVALSPNAIGATTLSVFNSNTAGAVYSSVLNFSGFPTWTTGATLANVSTGTFFGVNLVATSDSTITYANTTALPAGATLASNGYFYGTVTTGVTTTYSFDVDAKDAENQDTIRTFSMTVTIVPPYKLWSWGNNTYGVLAQNDQVSRSSPTQVGALTDWTSTKNASGWLSNFSIKTNGTLWAWGGNANGTLALNDRVYRSSPVQVGALTNWNMVTTASYLTLATKTDGTLWAWGYGNNGGSGLNDAVSRSSPVQVGAGTSWSLVNTAQYTSFAIKTDGTLWSWGRNSFGQLGKNDVIYRSSPTQVGAGTNWSFAGARNSIAFGIKTDGTLWYWGNGSNGKNGSNINDAIANTSSPVQIGTNTNWSSISWQTSVLATRTDGTLWSWGYNSQGQLGLNDTNGRSSPTQIGVATNWSQASSTSGQSMAIKTTGTLWSIGGANGNGTSGLNNTTSTSSPIQVGTATNWVTLYGSDGAIFATST